MSIANIIGDLNLTLSIPGELKSNGKTVGEAITLVYANERLRVQFSPIDAEGRRLGACNCINQLNYNRGTINLIGRETNRNVNYSATYSVLKRQLHVTVGIKRIDIRVNNLSEAIGTIAKLIVTSIPKV